MGIVFVEKYLKLLVEEIRYQNRQLVMKGSYVMVKLHWYMIQSILVGVRSTRASNLAARS